MEFEWDERKRRTNLAKHGIDFEAAKLMFEGTFIEREDRRRGYGERRIVAYGEASGVVLCVVYTRREDRLRIISVRRARRDERKDYHAATSARRTT
jgi:uncharacterized DUF497 family protein